jgi:hypothetical protein
VRFLFDVCHIFISVGTCIFLKLALLVKRDEVLFLCSLLLDFLLQNITNYQNYTV